MYLYVFFVYFYVYVNVCILCAVLFVYFIQTFTLTFSLHKIWHTYLRLHHLLLSCHVEINYSLPTHTPWSIKNLSTWYIFFIFPVIMLSLLITSHNIHLDNVLSHLTPQLTSSLNALAFILHEPVTTTAVAILSYRVSTHLDSFSLLDEGLASYFNCRNKSYWQRAECISSPHFPTHPHFCSCMLSSSGHNDGLLLPLSPHPVHWVHLLSSTQGYCSCSYTFPQHKHFPLHQITYISIQTCWNISHLKKKIYFLTRVVSTCYRHFSISYSPFNSFQSGFLPHSCTETVLGNFTSNLHVLKSTGQFWVLYLNSSRLLFSNYSIILEALSSLGFWVIQNCEWYSSSGSLLNLLFSRPLNMTESQDSVPSPQTSSLYSVLGYVTYPFALNAN